MVEILNSTLSIPVRIFLKNQPPPGHLPLTKDTQKQETFSARLSKVTMLLDYNYPSILQNKNIEWKNNHGGARPTDVYILPLMLQ